ncbi:MAG: DNA gyrase subunit A [Cyanobacteria bacterium]|nr:DNA gyrase subunit A [Cyanobacteriota bacterium]MDA1020363.1 DNA gyrase subunit A [Cyanobacteriota bacterium]
MKELFRTGGKITEITIRDEMKQSFIDYAMSVIVSRALPDVRDGLKPVHRRILYAMHDMGMYPDKAFKKCARIVGEVLGKYHPHGDTAVYDSLVRLAQPFSSRYTLVSGHGNFGSLDDGPAAMRYTEAKLDKVSVDFLTDIESETVDFVDNFDGSLKEPKVLPSKIPGLLVNGSTGIAVGMATNIPPHNLTEVMNGVIALIDNPEIEFKEMNKIIKGPDFPSGCTILGTNGIVDAFTTGKGGIKQKATYTIEEISKGKSSSQTAIVITELPYLVGAEAFITKVAELVKNERITGIADANDESGRDGRRIVIKLKRDANPQVVANNLLKYTQLQQNFSTNMVALVNGKPRQLTLMQILKEFVEFRVEVVTRKAQFDLKKAEARHHIVEGLLIAIGDIDAVIKLIKKSANTEEAREGLMQKFKLSEKQASAILDMQLRRLTGLELEKLEKEKKELEKTIKSLIRLLASRKLILDQVKIQSEEVIKNHGDERKTQIARGTGDDMSMEDLIADEKMAIFITKQGYVKRIPLITFERQRRATKGKGGIKTRDEDDLLHFFVTSMHDTLLFFTDKGQVYSTKVYDLPEGSRQAKGQALVNFISVKSEDEITAVIPTRDFDEGTYLSMLTKQGTVKKTSLADFATVRKSGIIAIGLEKGDALNWVRISDGTKSFILGTRDGMVIRYSESEVRSMGRVAKGVKAMTLRKGDELVGFDIVDSENEDTNLLVITNDGFGKRIKIGEFRVQGRGGLGLIGTKFKTPKSKLATIRVVSPDDEFIIATSNGVVVRQRTGDISFQSRMATGSRIIKLGDDDEVVSINPIIDPENDEQVMSAAEIEAEGSEQLVLTASTKEVELPPDEEPLEELD